MANMCVWCNTEKNGWFHGVGSGSEWFCTKGCQRRGKKAFSKIRIAARSGTLETPEEFDRISWEIRHSGALFSDLGYEEWQYKGISHRNDMRSIEDQERFLRLHSAACPEKEIPPQITDSLFDGMTRANPP